MFTASAGQTSGVWRQLRGRSGGRQHGGRGCGHVSPPCLCAARLVHGACGGPSTVMKMASSNILDSSSGTGYEREAFPSREPLLGSPFVCLGPHTVVTEESPLVAMQGQCFGDLSAWSEVVGKLSISKQPCQVP